MPRHKIRFIRLLAAGAVTVAAAFPLAQAAQAHPDEPEVPADIAVPEGNKAYLDVHAVGVQIYSCDGSAWTFVAPRATLYDRGRRFGTHFAGPTWQAKGGSTVVGSRVNGVNVDPTAIDWLLLSARPTAEGRLGKTTFIQRIKTTGGRAPAAADCNAATAGTQVEIPYTADYVFWKARRGH
jgi:FtsP/CotA-like multicopper oxidase with cupredoxin domain